MTNFDDWLEENEQALLEEYTELKSDEWSCEEQLMKLLESDAFMMWCEDKYSEGLENGN